MRATRRAGGGDVFRGRQVVMLAVFALTVQAWLLAVAYEHHTPPAHALLDPVVLLLSLVQVTIGAMRPSDDAGASRSVWTTGHRIVALSGFCVAAYTCHHSIYVFELPQLPAAAIHTCLSISILAMLAAEFAPPNMCKRITGRRVRFFENGGAEHHIQKVQDDPLGSGVDFHVAEDDIYEISREEEGEESALSLKPEEGNTASPTRGTT